MFSSDRQAFVSGDYWLPAFRLVLIGLLVTQAALFVYPTGFAGGPTDDQRYLEATLAWLHHGPQAGTTHWALRHPLVLSLVGAFALFGEGLDQFLLVPRVYYGVFVAASVLGVSRLGGRRAALVWIALAATNPLLHDMATSVFPEMVELAFATVAMWGFVAAATAPGRAKLLWAALSGLTLGLAILTRETAVALLPVMAWSAWRDPRVTRPMLGVFGLAIALPILADNIWLWTLSGDPMWRIHVDRRHTLIASDHLRGHVYRGQVMLNPDLARRWTPSGPTRIHWILNPLLDFLIDPNFGAVIAAWLIAQTRRLRHRPETSDERRQRRVLLLIAIGTYLTVTWVFTLRPQPRYYMFVVAAAITGLSLYAGRALDRTGGRRAAVALVGAAMLVGTVVILTGKDGGWAGKLASGYIAGHPGRYSGDGFLVGRSWWRLRLVGKDARLSTRPMRVGDYWVRQVGYDQLSGHKPLPRDPHFRQTALLINHEPLLVRVSRPWFRRGILIERRVW